MLSHTQHGQQISKHSFIYTDPSSDISYIMAALFMALLVAPTYACWIRSKIMHFVFDLVPIERHHLLVMVALCNRADHYIFAL